MSDYPESADIFSDKAPNNTISSSDPNAAYDAIENVENLVGALGKPQSWSETLLNVMRYYRRGMRVEMSGGSLLARAGEAVLVDTNGNKILFRRNPADVTIGAGNLDSGTLAATFYYVYARSNGAALTAPMVYSTDINAPSGIGTHSYMKIGWFKNEAVGSLSVTYAGSWKEYGDEPNILFMPAVTTTYALGTVTAFSTIPDTFINFVSSGRPIKIIAKILFSNNNASGGAKLAAMLNIDGTDNAQSLGCVRLYAPGSNVGTDANAVCHYVGSLASGAHQVIVKWWNQGDTGYVGIPRTIMVEES